MQKLIPSWNETFNFEFQWHQEGVDAMREIHKNNWQKAFDEKPHETEVSKHLPMVQQLKRDLDGLKAETLPDLQSQMNGLKQATREILELLGPRNFELPNFGDVIRTEECPPGIPELPSQPSAAPSPLPELLDITEVSDTSPKQWVSPVSAGRGQADLTPLSSNGGRAYAGRRSAPGVVVNSLTPSPTAKTSDSFSNTGSPLDHPNALPLFHPVSPVPDTSQNSGALPPGEVPPYLELSSVLEHHGDRLLADNNVHTFPPRHAR